MMNHKTDITSTKSNNAKKVTPPKGTKLPVKTTTTLVNTKKNQKSSYLIPTKSSFENLEINNKNKNVNTGLNNQNINKNNHLQDADLNKINNNKQKSSSQVKEMINRFRYAKPMPSNQREKQNFWWNDDDVSTEFSDVIEDDENIVNVNESNGNFIKNLKDLDLKARELIDKSEFTLSEKLISSEGLGSTSNTTITSSQISSTIPEEAAYKPDFIKYIETKNRLETDPFKMNPNEDILQKWRLRRKLEETKSTAVHQNQHNHNIEDFLGRKAQTIVHQASYYYQQQQQQEQPVKAQEPATTTKTLIPTLAIPETTTETARTSKISPNRDYQTTSYSSSSTARTTTKTSTIATMTSPQRTETAVQTSIDNNNYMEDKPTRDESRLAKEKLLLKKNNNNKNNFIRTRKSSKSPTYKSTSTTIYDKTLITSSIQKSSSNISDLTKISSIFDANNKLSIDEMIDNYEDQQQPNETNNSDIVVYNNNNNNQHKDNKDNRIVNGNNLIFDSSYYESDELLNILFKKLFFYQSKLENIETLIEDNTKSNI